MVLMNWKTVVGWVLAVLGGVGLARAIADLGANSYAVGNLTGATLIVLLGVWLLRSGQPAVRK
jgi:hypothetical protein